MFCDLCIYNGDTLELELRGKGTESISIDRAEGNESSFSVPCTHSSGFCAPASMLQSICIIHLSLLCYEMACSVFYVEHFLGIMSQFCVIDNLKKNL
jgi:hypothetical protein